MEMSDAIATFIEEMGADLQVMVRPLPMDERLNKCAVVWDRVYEHSDRPRVILRAAMGTQGVDDSSVAHLAAYPAPSSTPPLQDQIEKFRGRTIYMLDKVKVKYVLLVGAGALDVWRPDLRMEQAEGNVGVLEGRWVCMAVKNPMAAVIDPQLQTAWREMIVKWCEVVNRDEGLRTLGNTCAERGCRGGVQMYDPDGIPWCKAHVEGGTKERRNARKRRVKKMNKQMQGGML